MPTATIDEMTRLLKAVAIGDWGGWFEQQEPGHPQYIPTPFRSTEAPDKLRASLCVCIEEMLEELFGLDTSIVFAEKLHACETFEQAAGFITAMVDMHNASEQGDDQ